MNPDRLVPLVDRALGRRGTTQEYLDWAAVLGHVTDDDGDAALLAVRSTIPHRPEPADVRKAATAIANDRAMRAQAEQLRRERATGVDAQGRPLVPMPAYVRAELREFERKQQARAAALAGSPDPTGQEATA